MKYITKIAETGSITKASKELFVSQSYLSRLINEIEEDLKIIIFIRTHTGVTLTTEGEELVKYSYRVLNEYDNILKIKDSSIKEESYFKLSSAKSLFVVNNFISLLEEYSEDERVRFKFIETENESVLEDVYFLNADLGVLNIYSLSKDTILEELSGMNIVYEKICNYIPHISVRKDHPLTIKGSARLTDLYEYGLVRYNEKDLYLRDDMKYIDNFELVLDLNKFNHIVEVTDRATLHLILNNTNYISLGTQAGNHEDNKFNLVPVKIIKDNKYLDPGMEMGIIYRKDSEMTSVGKRFIKTLKEKYSDE